ncbi:hypothetical protein ACHQM5_012165 [Ranunculus cassubicifolius]
MAAGIVTKISPPNHHLICNSSSSNPKSTTTLNCSSFRSDFHGFKIVLPQMETRKASLPMIQMSLVIGKAHRWWQKGVEKNMKEISTAQDLVDSLRNAGDKLVIVDFFSPGCGGCKALHPKICQFAEQNPDIEFLQVNHEEHKSMCYSLNVHVLPFFRFYRGAHGRLCSFSCTNATIKKFRDALGKHKPERCSLGPTKGLEEKELLALAANRDLNFTYTPEEALPEVEEPVPADIKHNPVPSRPRKESEEKTLVTAN